MEDGIPREDPTLGGIALKEEARKLIAEWDEDRGEGWSDCSAEISEIMSTFAKSKVLELLDQIRSLTFRTCESEYSDFRYVDSDDIYELVESWEVKL